MKFVQAPILAALGIAGASSALHSLAQNVSPTPRQPTKPHGPKVRAHLKTAAQTSRTTCRGVGSERRQRLKKCSALLPQHHCRLSLPLGVMLPNINRNCCASKSAKPLLPLRKERMHGAYLCRPLADLRGLPLTGDSSPSSPSVFL